MLVRKEKREGRDHKKVLQISLKSDMYNLSVFRYLNHVLFGAIQKYYVFKNLEKFETSQKKSKSQSVGVIYFTYKSMDFSW